MTSTLVEQKNHLSFLLVAVQRSAWFLNQSAGRVDWPLTGEVLNTHRKDVAFFETLAEHFNAINELLPILFGTATNLLAWIDDVLSVSPASDDFKAEFEQITLH